MSDVLHWITLGLYSIVLGMAFRILLNAYKLRCCSEMPKWVVVFGIALVLQTTAFMSLQIDWVINNHDDDVGDATSYMWLLFDYFNGAVMYAYAQMVLIFIQWKHPNEPNRRSYDR